MTDQTLAFSTCAGPIPFIAKIPHLSAFAIEIPLTWPIWHLECHQSEAIHQTNAIVPFPFKMCNFGGSRTYLPLFLMPAPRSESAVLRMCGLRHSVGIQARLMPSLDVSSPIYPSVCHNRSWTSLARATRFRPYGEPSGTTVPLRPGSLFAAISTDKPDELHCTSLGLL